MAIIQGDVIGGSAGFYPKEIEQSLRFNDDDSAYLSWTPASAGNRKTWTFSTWVKRGNLGSEWHILSAGPNDTSPRGFLRFNSDNTLSYGYNNGSTWYIATTVAVFRDISSWYHVVVKSDLTNGTNASKVLVYVNGVQQSFASTPTWDSNDQVFNNSVEHRIARQYATSSFYFDGYLAETHFTDGTAYDATAFGEFKNGVWVAKEFAGTYGTNGFYLPFRNDYTVEGFSATTYQGTGGDNYVGGVGFNPDLTIIKRRDSASNFEVYDSVRGVSNTLFTNLTNAESTGGTQFVSLENDGFLLDSSANNINASGGSYVAWCWDAGTGSPVSNTDGSITSTVKANPDRGFSVADFTFQTSGTATIGHGLTSAPEMVIVKGRNWAGNWHVWHTGMASGTYNAMLNSTSAASDSSAIFSAAPTSSVVNLGSSWGFGSGNTGIAYCFHSVSGYSKMGSYTGTGASGNTVTTGFKPAFVMVKRTDSTGNWEMHDATRAPYNSSSDRLWANLSNAEDSSEVRLSFTSTGFELITGAGDANVSGATYIYMAFADTREAAFWLDDSGNNNDWENNGLTESDISLDSPTNNFATLNPLDSLNGTTYFVLSEGNLRRTYSPSGSDLPAWSTFSLSSGKWYFETACITNGYLGDRFRVGVTNGKTFDSVGNNANSYGYAYDGNKYNNSSGSAYGSTYTEGDIIGTALDLDAGTLTFYKNGVSQGTAFTGLSGEFFFGMAEFQSSVMVANFGQDSSFAGNKVPQGYTDANGRGDFYYAPPAGYLALCTANLPEPAIGPNSETTADQHFNIVLYTGNGSTSERLISGVGFDPDFSWVKARSLARAHQLVDRVRGYLSTLYSDFTNAEEDVSTSVNGGIGGVATDGFYATAGTSSNDNYNGSGQTYVAWNWKANGSGVSNTDGSITSTVSANVDAGFSIIAYNGTGSAGTIGHGLTKAPALIIAKSRSVAAAWPVWHQAFGTASNSDYLRLNDTISKGYYGAANYWNNTVPTSSVLSIGTDGDINTNGSTNIIYACAEIEGFSKFGSYTGNGSTDGTFVYTGMRPKYVLLKNVSVAGDWWVVDTSRSTVNVATAWLNPNTSGTESSAISIDLLSNGFKFRSAAGNDNGQTWIYATFAENPFKYSNAR